MNRNALIDRKTAETTIRIELDLDASDRVAIRTPVPFLDHMLELFAFHSGFGLAIPATGDTHIDDHHSVEDAGIALGEALKAALGDKKGIRRYADVHLPMDETLTRVAVDVSGRPFLVFRTAFKAEKIGSFDTELVREFFQALSTHGGITLHVDLIHGLNSHHIAEAAFKAVARALREAVEPDPRMAGALPSTKGAL